MTRMFCEVCGREMVKESRVLGDPALDRGGDCWGCIAEVEQKMTQNPPPMPCLNRYLFPDIYDVIAEVYGGATVPLKLPDSAYSVEAGDLRPLRQTPDGTPI